MNLDHRIMGSWKGSGTYLCKCGASIEAGNEDKLRWGLLDHCVDHAEKQARAEVLAASTRLHEAARWVLHVVAGVGKAGGPPHFGEEFAAWKELQASVDKLQPAAKDLEEFKKRVQQESYGAARILWTAGICDLLKIPKPKPDESGLEWVLREGSRALEALLREAELKSWLEGHISGCNSCRSKRLWCEIAKEKEAELAELEKARAEGKG